MKTTIKEIYQHRPCSKGFAKLLNGLFGTEFNEDMNIVEMRKSLTEKQFSSEVSILEILNINGIEDAYWALRTQDYIDYCLVLADVAESVLHIYENKYSSKSPRKAITAIREYKNDLISLDDLKEAAVAVTAYDASAYEASASASEAADASAYAAARSAAYAATAYAAYASKKQWQLNGEILRKHLEEK